MADQKVSVDINANASQAVAEWGRFGDVAQRVMGGLNSTAGMAQGVVGMLTSRYTALVGVLSGGVLATAVRQQLELMDASSKAAAAGGVATEQFSSMAYAAKLADVDTESLTKTYAKLSALLVDGQQGQKAAVDLFSRLRIDPAQLADSDALLLALADRFSEIHDGAQRTALAADVFGERLGPRLVPLLSAGSQGLTELREEAARLGLVVSGEAGTAAENFNDTLTRIQQRTQGLAQQLATAMLPALQNTASAFLDTYNNGMLVQGVSATLRTTFEAVAVLGANVAFVLRGIGREGAAIAAQLGLVYDVLRAKPGEIMAAAQRAWTGWSAIGDAVKADGERARQELDLFERRVLGLGGAGTRQSEDRGFTPQIGQPAGFTPGAKTPTPATETSRMAQWEAELAQRKAALTAQGLAEGQFREMSLAEEATYWAALRGRQDLAQGERFALARKTAETELAVIREGFDAKVRALQEEATQYRSNFDERIRIEAQIQSMYQAGTKQYDESSKRIAELRRQQAQQEAMAAGERLAAQQQARAAEIDLAEQSVLQLQQLGLADQLQVLQSQEVFERQRSELYMQGLRDRLVAAQADPDRNPVELARIHRQLEEAEQQHALRMGQIRGQIASQTTADIRGTINSVQAGWSSLIQQLFAGTLTIGGFIRGIFQTVAQAVVQTFANMVAQWAAQKLAMLILGKSTAATEISAAAAKAGANGVASMAGAPFPANMGAPLFGAAMAAAAAGFGAMASAAGGYDIPAGINPMVQAHQREMILPATLADTVRDMAAVYQQGGGGGGAPIQINFPPPTSFDDILMTSRRGALKAIEAALKDKNRKL